jgi:tripartite ATP-independent transporter DctP family solute receptor
VAGPAASARACRSECVEQTRRRAMKKGWQTAGIGLIAAGIAGTAAAKEFRSSDVHPEDYPTVMAVKYMSDIISKKTGGKDTIKVYTGSTLGGEKDTIEQTKIGALDLVRINVAPMNNICPETMVPTMPFLFKSKEHMRKVLDGPIGEEILKACEKQGFIGLAFYDSGSRSLYTVKKPVKSLADAKGMKIRVQQSDLWVALLQAMGANATPMPYGEVYTALKVGTVDGAENNWPSYDTSRHFEVAKFYAMTEHSMAPEMLLMSKKVWDGLTPDQQKIFREAAKESVPYMRKLWDEKEAKSKAAVIAGGATIVEVDKKSFQDAMKPVYEKFITDPKMKDMVSKIQATQ